MQYGGNVLAVGVFSFFDGNDFGGRRYYQNMAVNRHITGTAHQGGNFTAVQIPTTTLLFFVKFSTISYLYPCNYIRNNPENTSVCHHDLAIHNVSVPPCRLDRGGVTTSKQNIGSTAAGSRGCRVLSIPDDSEAVSSYRTSIGARFVISDRKTSILLTDCDSTVPPVVQSTLVYRCCRFFLKG